MGVGDGHPIVMENRMSSGRRPGWVKVAAVVVVTLAVIYSVNLAELWLKNRRAMAVEANLQAEVERQRVAIERIEAEAARARSDAYVEEFARNEKGWVLPGDHQVVPLPADVAAPPDPDSEPDAADPSPDGSEPGNLIERVLQSLERDG